MAAPRFRILALDLFERDVVLRLPFRFGVVTLTACPQAFVRARIEVEGGIEAVGVSAELLAPKWFDKNLMLTEEDNFGQLRASLRLARKASLADSTSRSAFRHAASCYKALIDEGSLQGLNPLVIGFGSALIDRALLDALCRALDVSFYDAIRYNAPGVDASLTPDLGGFDLDRFLAGCRQLPHIDVRHTVGLVDPITPADVTSRVNDGLPQTLEEVITVYGNRYFKLKVSGDVDADIARLTRIAAVLDCLTAYVITLDGNEQFIDSETAVRFWRQLESTPALRRMAGATLYIEQPLPRAITLETDITALASAKPVLIDEADGTLDAFPQAMARGYTGVSSKNCKGFYKSLLNAARCARRNGEAGPRFFMSAEDLTTQAGLAVQQDLALVNLLGLRHVERNGHHYVYGFAGQGASRDEQRAFAEAHPDLYEGDAENVRLRLHGGRLHLKSLDRPGFATSAYPDFTTMTPIS